METRYGVRAVKSWFMVQTEGGHVLIDYGSIVAVQHYLLASEKQAATVHMTGGSSITFVGDEVNYLNGAFTAASAADTNVAAIAQQRDEAIAFLRGHRVWLANLESTMPIEEYRRQMALMQSVIARCGGEKL